jgi:putative NADH-flavin reductase
MSAQPPLKIVVIGSTGYVGSHVCVELISRGHHVTGLTRKPEKLGSHPNYKGYSIDLTTARIADMIEALAGHNVIVKYLSPSGVNSSQYIRPSHRRRKSPLQYLLNQPSNLVVPYIEVTRKLIIAMKQLKTPYLITVGGGGSLALPNKPFTTALESPHFWLAYLQHAADSPAYRSYALARFPKFALMLQRYHDIRSADVHSEEDEEFLAEMVKFAGTRVTESHFIMACRATLQFYEGNKEFKWTFLSPPAGFKPGPKTGKFEVDENAVLPLRGGEEPPYEGRLLGITVRDLALAIGEEVERQTMVGKHWTAWTPEEDAVDEPPPDIYASLGELES